FVQADAASRLGLIQALGGYGCYRGIWSRTRSNNAAHCCRLHASCVRSGLVASDCSSPFQAADAASTTLRVGCRSVGVWRLLVPSLRNHSPRRAVWHLCRAPAGAIWSGGGHQRSTRQRVPCEVLVAPRTASAAATHVVRDEAGGRAMCSVLGCAA